MAFYKFIKLEGPENKHTGYFVPRMYHLGFNWKELKGVGFLFVKERLKGHSIWWVDNEDDYQQAIKTLKELKKTRIFDYKVLK